MSDMEHRAGHLQQTLKDTWRKSDHMPPFPSLEAGTIQEQGWWRGMGVVVLGGAIVPSCCRIVVCLQREVGLWASPPSSLLQRAPRHPNSRPRLAAPAVQLSPVASGGAETSEDLSSDC